MKKIIAGLVLFSFISAPTACIAQTTEQEEVKAPVWEEYVPEKYQNPISFPDKKKNITELSVGIALTDLLVTAPIGIPMIVHATTKIKNQGWYEKKKIYDKGLIEAQSITNPTEKKAFYENLKKQCNLTEKRRKKQLKKMAKKKSA